MIHLEEQIIEIAQDVMTDIEWPYDENKGITAIFVSLEEQFERWKNMKNFQREKHKLFPYWNVMLDFPVEDKWEGRNLYFMEIKDEDGEPYLLGHRQAKFKVLKNELGKYYTMQIVRG